MRIRNGDSACLTLFKASSDAMRAMASAASSGTSVSEPAGLRSLGTKHRLPFVYTFRSSVHGTFMAPSPILLSMGDFMAVLGIILFALAMLGLIWGLDHV
jgi:hypothetical protein